MSATTCTEIGKFSKNHEPAGNPAEVLARVLDPYAKVALHASLCPVSLREVNPVIGYDGKVVPIRYKLFQFTAPPPCLLLGSFIVEAMKAGQTRQCTGYELVLGCSGKEIDDLIGRSELPPSGKLGVMSLAESWQKKGDDGLWVCSVEITKETKVPRPFYAGNKGDIYRHYYPVGGLFSYFLGVAD